jgi:toxin HigB-1
METEFDTQELYDLYTKRDFSAGYGKEIVKGYRKRIQIIKAAKDERDLYAIKSNHFEKLKGDRAHERSLRINRKMRLIVEIKEGTPKNKVLVKGIEDYH